MKQTRENNQMKTVEEAGDMELIRAFSGGDEAAFEVLYHRYRRQLYGFLNNLIPGNSAEVDEVFEETWLRVIEKLPKYRDDGRFSAWLFRIGRNIFIDRIRKLRPEREGAVPLDAETTPDMPGPAAMEPVSELDSGEVGKVIADAVARLPEEQREVFLLRQQDLAFKEIAEIQNCSINTVLGRMQYAIRNLRKLIREIDRGGVI